MNTQRLARRLPLVTLVTCVGLCLAGLDSASGTQRGAAPAAAGDPGEEARGVTLAELHAAPADWLGRRVRFTFQLHSTPGEWNPCLTRFGARDYVAVVAWSDEQLLWRAAEHEAPLAMLFARRGSATAAALADARTYGRFEAEGRVLQVFLGRPWIEIDAVERLPEEIGEGAILHTSRALASMRGRGWKLALNDLTRAADSNLPPHARLEIERLRAECESALAAGRRPGRR